MMNRLRCPLAQICQRASAKPSQPRKAMIPGTSGRFSFDHDAGGLGRRDLSSSDVDVSCNRKPPPWLSQRDGKFLIRRAQLTRATPYAVTGCNEYEPPASTLRTCGDRAEKRGGGEGLRPASHHRGAARPGPPPDRPPPAHRGRVRARGGAAVPGLPAGLPDVPG